ncbi:hypothetical protein [Brevibacillus centrosporus]|uniref:Copper amine oxidase N-terminal domain-containing protein n=1 Tax=Brevibacillus centrosporus TaxID=54910 RepID=A0A1I3XSS4_9BACL|nr:hypothetical protein [Brevibacillus centrosporus]MED4910437.1 copper amine oxidase N-terminal domain-containing protein [Brevibacillus centrosporus]SFK22349.1 hypothetical protein SAMN05518846_11053 [Brevibacillus centrosporus]
MKTIRTGMMTLAALAVLGTNVVSATSEPVKELSVNVNGEHIEQAAIFDKGTDDAVTVVDEESDVAPVRTGTITTLNKSEDGRVSFQLNGYETGIILHVDKDTKITTADGKELKPEDLKLGMEVEATHQKFMAMSMPPQSGAVTIMVKSSLETPEVLGTAGKVVSIDKDQEGTYKMVVEGRALTENAPEKVALIINEDTKIVSAKDNKTLTPEDLKADMNVFAYYGPKLTRSLPPIGVAEKIVVE